MIILLSKSSLNDNYSSWLRRLNPDIHMSDAYMKSNLSLNKLILRCSGIILTGGADINPARYGQATEINRCESIDDQRDEMELKLIAAAFENRIPLLAICRGMQIINISFNGTLVVDIPSDLGKKVEHRNKADVNHRITIAKDSDLYQYGRASELIVNSSHHQAILTIGSNLIPVAWSDDGLIEAVQLNGFLSHPFFTGVQWHPERMEVSHPMSGIIGRAFLRKAEEFRKK
jgi:putative glutamine amidotransferase